VPWKLSDVWTVSARCCTRCLHAQRLSGRFSTPTGVLAFLDQLHPCGRSTYLPTWLADARIDRAREILETTTEPVENIGHLTGLGAPVSVRAAFHRRIGISPKEYRAVWRGSSTSATATATLAARS